ncbi:bis(5'-nucleosyl)-tetraphosphatase (symmetrical) ApaH [Candidatus Erwinia haradaeae]|uniref:Bis(5'-nucleosyl)-tetraphosphatase, symmetrical n=1 Tax=Candidatus Erwinia haradaeae TaxID=1922217 RepID=A0A451D963_9GAMM|nr:bis(5'-nucleosyl)-tetraphosphatase (symmetrical) ApaH [Candidatus Erwinia haradaeae]VFP82760.1 Bis(5'-nucleosyl)-tetraphosphatase [symmetrical] [Candidatus Erwinia haradaeae]
MSTYLIGDIHGCYHELQLLLSQIQFNPGEDKLWITGDVVGRGPHSLEVLRLLYAFKHCIKMVLGNHDLNLLAMYAGKSYKKPKAPLKNLLKAHDVQLLLNWLRHQPLLQVDEKNKIIMSHAGITPQWDMETVRMCAREVEEVLISKSYVKFLESMYGDTPNFWSQDLAGFERLRFSSNALTRMRYCFPDGHIDMVAKTPPDRAPFPLQPWFNMPSLITRDYTIIFGHWAALAGKGLPQGVIGLDTGCCWGGHLTILRWEDKKIFVQASLNKR